MEEWFFIYLKILISCQQLKILRYLERREWIVNILWLKLIYTKFNKVFKLNTIMRQKGKEQQEFRQLLGRLANGNIDEEDYDLIKLWFTTNILRYSAKFDGVLRLKARKEGISEYDECRLRNLGNPFCIVHASHNNLIALRWCSKFGTNFVTI